MIIHPDYNRTGIQHTVSLVVTSYSILCPLYTVIKASAISVLLMYEYSACCRRPGGTPRTDQDDDQDLAQRRMEREGHRGQREERGERDYSCPSSSQREEGGGARLFLSQLIYPPPTFPPPPSTYPGPERRGGGSQPADPWTREEGRGQPAS